MSGKWSVTFYGDFRSYFMALRNAGVIAHEPEGSRKAAMLEQLIDTRASDGGGEDDEGGSDVAHIDVENAEELADILAALRADDDNKGHYGYGVRYSRQAEEARVWSAIGSTGYYGEMCGHDSVRLDVSKLNARADKAIREALRVLNDAVKPEVEP